MNKLQRSGYYVSTSQYNHMWGCWDTVMQFVGSEPVEGSWFHREGELVNAIVQY